MKITHRIPIQAFTAGTPTETQEREVAATMRKVEARHRAALKAVERAEELVVRLSLVGQSKSRARSLSEARKAVIARREELLAVERLMAHPPGSERTGKGFVRLTPKGRAW